jgi:predicted DNA-binding protein (MmcQ/YjbR family)
MAKQWGQLPTFGANGKAFFMDIEQFRTYCLNKPGTTEDFPFGPDTLVLKVMGKIFALVGLDAERFQVNLKLEPDYGLEMREQYTEVQPGFHMNKVHWNTVDFEGSLDDKLLRHLTDHSYEQVVKTLKKVDREALALLVERGT